MRYTVIFIVYRHVASVMSYIHNPNEVVGATIGRQSKIVQSPWADNICPYAPDYGGRVGTGVLDRPFPYDLDWFCFVGDGLPVPLEFAKTYMQK